jgi:hypothetical protein
VSTRRSPKQGWAVFCWALVFFGAAQLLLAGAMERWRPEWRDREYGRKAAQLRQCLADHPGRPLALMLGSSRTVYAFRPEEFHPLHSPSGERYVGFNFGVAAAGPVKECVCLQSLLDDGIRPDLVLVEVLPPMLNEPGPGRFCEENWIHVPGLAASEVRQAQAYSNRPGRMGRAWLRSRLVPWHAHRERILDGWHRPLEPGRTRPLDRMDAFGWIPAEWEAVSPQKRREETDFARQQYAPCFADFSLGEGPARAVRDLVDRCRADGIGVALVLMPEGSEFRSWYPPSMLHAVDGFLAELQQAQGVPLLDARTWVKDADFWDSHHLLPAGATAFSRRLARELAEVLPGPARVARQEPSPHREAR